MQNQLIDKQFEYNKWANTELIGVCAGLSAEQLATTLPGTAGSIRDILIHMVGAEGYYVNRISGEWTWSAEPDWENISIADLRSVATTTGQRLRELASMVDPMHAYDSTRNDAPYRFYNFTILTQALYHGTEHRTQVKMMLTHLGVEHPELAVWDFTATLPANVS